MYCLNVFRRLYIRIFENKKDFSLTEGTTSFCILLQKTANFGYFYEKRKKTTFKQKKAYVHIRNSIRAIFFYHLM